MLAPETGCFFGFSRGWERGLAIDDLLGGPSLGCAPSNVDAKTLPGHPFACGSRRWSFLLDDGIEVIDHKPDSPSPLEACRS